VAFVSNRAIYGRGGYSFVAVYELAANRLTYMSPGLGYDQNPTWSPDGRRLAFLRVPMAPKSFRFSDFRSGPPFSIVVAHAETGAGRTLFSAPRGAGSVFSPMTSYPDYDRLYRPPNLFWTAANRLVFPWERTGWRHLYAIDADALGEPRALTRGEFEVSGAVLSGDRRRLAVTANPGEALRPRVFIVDAESGAMTAMPDRSAQNVTAWCSSNTCLASEQWDPLVPSTYYVSQLGRSSGATSPLEPDSVNDRRAPGAVEATTFQFTTRDGLALDAVVYRPAGVAARRLPVVIYAHGGSRWQATPGRTFDVFEALPHALAAHGFVYVAINYRSGVGYGAAFREPEHYGARSEGGGDIDDFVDLARFLRRQSYVDPDRIGVFGVSYGGYIVGNLLARHSDTFKAGASISGVGDWVREMENDTGRVLNLNISMRAEIEDRAYRSSAISAVDTWRSPLLLVHGDADTDGHMEADIELWTALIDRGVEVETLMLPNETHTISRWDNRVAVQQAVLSFFARRLGVAKRNSGDDDRNVDAGPQ
jgi:dipeptidyl aminopeptidase/acylaminoacyl peptidase